MNRISIGGEKGKRTERGQLRRKITQQNNRKHILVRAMVEGEPMVWNEVVYNTEQYVQKFDEH